MSIFVAMAIMDIIIGFLLIFLLKIIGSTMKTKKTTQDKISQDTDEFNSFS